VAALHHTLSAGAAFGADPARAVLDTASAAWDSPTASWLQATWARVPVAGLSNAWSRPSKSAGHRGTAGAHGRVPHLPPLPAPPRSQSCLHTHAGQRAPPRPPCPAAARAAAVSGAWPQRGQQLCRWRGRVLARWWRRRLATVRESACSSHSTAQDTQVSLHTCIDQTLQYLYGIRSPASSLGKQAPQRAQGRHCGRNSAGHRRPAGRPRQQHRGAPAGTRAPPLTRERTSRRRSCALLERPSSVSARLAIALDGPAPPSAGVHASLPVTSSRSAMPAGCPTRLPLLLGRQLAGLARCVFVLFVLTAIPLESPPCAAAGWPRAASRTVCGLRTLQLRVSPKLALKPGLSPPLAQAAVQALCVEAVQALHLIS